MSRQFFSTLVGMGSRSHDFDDELKISFSISYSVVRSKTLFFNKIYVFYTDEIFCTLSGYLDRIVLFLTTKYFEKWSGIDFTDVKSGRAGVEISAECSLWNSIGDKDCPHFPK